MYLKSAAHAISFAVRDTNVSSWHLSSWGSLSLLNDRLPDPRQLGTTGVFGSQFLGWERESLSWVFFPVKLEKVLAGAGSRVQGGQRTAGTQCWALAEPLTLPTGPSTGRLSALLIQQLVPQMPGIRARARPQGHSVIPTKACWLTGQPVPHRRDTRAEEPEKNWGFVGPTPHRRSLG